MCEGPGETVPCWSTVSFQCDEVNIEYERPTETIDRAPSIGSTSALLAVGATWSVTLCDEVFGRGPLLYSGRVKACSGVKWRQLVVLDTETKMRDRSAAGSRAFSCSQRVSYSA
jgi:hypothetical protein